MSNNIDRVLQKNIEIKQNNHRILSERVILVPYRSHHVKRYNEWMQDPTLQYLTGSEPLTLDDEYKMLESWNHDPEKCTFIILDREKYDLLIIINDDCDINHCEVESMIGDVNLYISSDDSDEQQPIGEIEIMIAEQSSRRKGFGRQATMLMLKFGYEILGIKKFQAKIKTSNYYSQRMFTEIFGFIELNRSIVFDEITYVCDLSSLMEHNHRLLQLFDDENKI